MTTNRNHFQLFFSLIIAASFFPIQVFAAQAMQPPAQKDTLSPAVVATFTVNTNSDNDTADDYLSLREAMNIATNSNLRNYSVAERTQTSGCAFGALGNVTGGCNAGNSLIQFSPGLTHILLTSRLPTLTNDGIVLDGAVSAGRMIIDANNAVDYGFNIGANNIIFRNLTVINISGFGAAIGSLFLLKGLQVYNNYLGIIPGASSCSDPAIKAHPYFTVILFGSSGASGLGNGTAYFYNNVIGCSQNDGINIASSVQYVYIGQTPTGVFSGNWIGVTPSGDNIGNGDKGITIDRTTNTQISANSISYNKNAGVYLYKDTATTIQQNDISHNKQAGIYLIDTATTSLSDNKVHDNESSGIWFDQSAPSPQMTYMNTILRDAYYHNGAAGISEGNGAGRNTWMQISAYDNLGLGIDKGNNGSPDPPSMLTITGTTPASPGVNVNGSLSGLIALMTDYHIELYMVKPDPTGYGEGMQYIGSTVLTWNMAGNYDWSIPAPGFGCYTAVLTIVDGYSNNSSEFTANYGSQCYLVNLPVIMK